MATTIKDIARNARVSTATVSLSLRDDPRIPDKTRARISRMADELGYVPSNLGRALQSRRSSLIGFLLADVTASFYNEILQGVGEAATNAGYGLLLCITSGSKDNARAHLKLMMEKRIDGLIVTAPLTSYASSLASINSSGTPVVVCSGEPFSDGTPGVVVDNQAGGGMAAEHLISLGHKRLAYCFQKRSKDAKRRHDGCVKAAKRHGITCPVTIASEVELLQALKSQETRPTGIVAYCDLDAIRIKRLATASGLRVPEDLSVVGFDDLWLAGQQEYDLTTIAQPKADIGRRSVDTLLRRIRGESVDSVKLAPMLVRRGSTAPPPPAR